MRLIKPIANILPHDVVKKIPVVGLVNVKLPNGKIVSFQTDGYDYTTSSLYWWGIDGYEVSTIKLFMHLLPRANTFFDIGANTGIYTLIAAINGNRRKVYGFEPVPRIFSALKQNIRVNSLENIEVFCVAISDYDGVIDLHIPPGRIPPGATTNPEIPTLKSAPEVLSVETVKFDTFVDSHSISKVDFIKIDTETTEPAVLEGAMNTLKNHRPMIICEVLRGRTENMLQSILDSIGYRYFWIADDALIAMEKIEGHSDNMNYLFVPREKVEETLKDIRII